MFLQFWVFMNLIGEKIAKTVFSLENNKMMRWIQSNILFCFLGVPGIH